MRRSGLGAGTRAGKGAGEGSRAGLRAALLGLCGLVAVLAAILTARTPQPRPADAPAGAFSAERAMADDRLIARAPHPEGSAAALAARDYIAGRMAALGLNPRRVTGRAVEVFPRLRGRFAAGGEIENLIGVLPGTDRAAPAVMLMAHSDSAPGSPGAADDAAGVVSALETVRALKAAGPHKRDVIVLITDGEEVGLLGARAFFASGDPLLKHIGMIVNMEARGGGGRVSMFETGARNGAAMALFAHAVTNTDALSLMGEVYKHLPNSTDFTVAKGAGYPGYNFAFLGEQFDYHSPSSTPTVLDRGSVQHMGDQVLALSRALADASALPAPRADAIYSDVLGGPVIVYPAAVGWALLILSAALAGVGAGVGARKSGERLGVGGVARGAGAALFGLMGVALVLHLVGRWLEGDLVRSRSLMAEFGLLYASVAALTGGAALMTWGAAFRGGRRWPLAAAALVLGLAASVPGGFDPFGLGLGVVTAVLAAATLGGPLKTWSGWLGVLIVGVVLTLVLQVLAPPLTVATAWPLLLGALTILLAAVLGRGGFGGTGMLFPTAVLGAIAAAHVGHLATPIFTAIGPDAPEALALLPFLGAMALYPLLEGGSFTGAGRAVDATLIGLGVFGLVVVALRDPATARTPRPVQAFYLYDASTGRTWRASTLDRLDPWSRAALTAGGAAVRRQEMGPALGQVWLAPAPPVALEAPSLRSDVQPTARGRRVTLTLTPSIGGREVRLFLQPTTPLTDVTLNGEATELEPKTDGWVQLRWDAPRGPITVAFTAKAGGALDLRSLEIADGWPPGAAAPPKPATDMPWGLSDDTVLLGRFQPRW